MTLKERQKRFIGFCSTAKLHKNFAVHCYAHGITTCLDLVNWNLGALKNAVLTTAIILSLVTYISFPGHVRATDDSKVAILVALCKNVEAEELDEMTKEGTLSLTGLDPAFSVGEGPEKIKKKKLADNMYGRLVSLYPFLVVNLNPEFKLSPQLVFDMTDALRQLVSLANWPNFSKVQTYNEVQSVNRASTGGGDGLVHMETTEYGTSGVGDYRHDGAMVRAMMNVRIVLLGFLAACSFHIDAGARDGTAGRAVGYGNRLFGTILGFWHLDSKIHFMAMHHTRVADFLNAWDKAFREIFRRVIATKVHLDDIIEKIVGDSEYFCSSNVITKRKAEAITDQNGKRHQGGGYTTQGGGFTTPVRSSIHACVDTLNGLLCRNGGPPPHGTCRYNHSPGALPSPNYVPDAMALMRSMGPAPPGVPLLMPPPPSGGPAHTPPPPPQVAGNNQIMQSLMMAAMMRDRGGRGRGRGRGR